MSSFHQPHGWLILFGSAFLFVMRMHAGGHARGGCGMSHQHAGGQGGRTGHEEHREPAQTGRADATPVRSLPQRPRRREQLRRRSRSAGTTAAERPPWAR